MPSSPKVEGPSTEQGVQRGPGSFTREGHSQGNVQNVGTTVPLSRNPVPIAPGKREKPKIEGPSTSCSMSTTPVKGFLGNGDIPMSQRSIAQSAMIGGKGKKARRG